MPLADLTPERPSVIVDRFHETIAENADADFLAFFADAGGTSGANIRILRRPDPIYEPGRDPLPAFFILGARHQWAFEIGGARLTTSVAWRAIYPEEDRFRDPGAADALSLVYKLQRALWTNLMLDTIPSTNDPRANKITGFQAVVTEGLEYPGDVCIDVIEGSVDYETIIDKDDI